MGQLGVDAGTSPREVRSGRWWTWKRVLPLAILATGLIAFLYFDLARFFSFTALSENRAMLVEIIEQNRILTALGFIAAYAVVVAFSLPVALFVTIAGGFLFGAVFGTVWVIAGATAGATIIFLIARSTVGEYLRAREGPTLKKMEAGFRANEWSYMFILRLVPLFPFYLVNIAPAFLGVRVRTFVVATFFGIMPGTFVYASIGAGADTLLDADQVPGLDAFLRPEIGLPMAGLVLLSLVPIVYRRFRTRPAP
jgi:uncharacterized membrane protein YdjX (TVP38/TMEM64 family)